MTTSRFNFFNQNPPQPQILAEVKHGLAQTPKRLSPKFFYDKQGSLLFDKITRLPEYYLTRTEVAILSECKDELASIVGTQGCLVEYGSGSSEKVRLLLSTLRPRFYVPVDISQEHLRESSHAIYHDYEDLNVYPTCADYTNTVKLPNAIDGARRCGFFPGSSIGNFEREAAGPFLVNVRNTLGPEGYCVVGFDARKSKQILESAYNDSQGVTAEFNLNLLDHLNSAIGSNFDTTKFEHQAFYEEELGRIEMHLISKCEQQLKVDGETYLLEADESIHTENSYKFSIDEIKLLADAADMHYVKHWEDERSWFFVVLLQAR